MEENQSTESEKDLSNKDAINSLKKKNWKSYFKEFFMLFLAVFCGFLAENYRESLSARNIGPGSLPTKTTNQTPTKKCLKSSDSEKKKRCQ